jgi:hypothetical protein
MVTVVLWAGPAVVATPLVLGSTGAYGVVEDGWARLLTVAATWVLLASVVVLLGWAERPLRLRRRSVPPPAEYVFEGNVAAVEQRT